MRARQETRPARGAPAAGRRFCPICDGSIEERICPRDGTATLSLEAARSDPDRLQAGMLIADRYRIENLIGTGGFAKVFRASHTGTGQSVALKVLNGVAFEDGPMMIRRFFREARASAGLRHPHTVRVFDFGQEENGTAYLAMELLTGRTLRAEVQRRQREQRPFSEEEAIRIALAICGSLGEAHALGLVHRDVGPSNIFLHQVAGSEPVVKVLDFGLVKDGGRPLTRAHQVFGTLAFMSPEQAIGRAVGPRSDLYSLGITIWWMIAGRQPFEGDTPDEVIRGHRKSPLPRLSDQGNRAVSDAFEAMLERATAKDVEDRFPDAQAFKSALESCLESVSERRHATTQVMEQRRPAPKRIALISVAIMLAMIAISRLWIGGEAEVGAAPIDPPVIRTEPLAIEMAPAPRVPSPAAVPVKREPTKPARARRVMRAPRPPAPAPAPMPAKASILKQRI